MMSNLTPTQLRRVFIQLIPRTKLGSIKFVPAVLLGLCLLTANPGRANIPGGGTGTGAAVTLVDNGSSVTIGNGIVSIVCTKSSAQIGTINYTFNNHGSPQTLNLLSGGTQGGKFYWENNTSESLSFTYTLITDPAGNGGNYAEISLVSTSVANIVMEVHYALLRGATGFYVTAIWTHRSTDGAISLGECRDNIYAGSIFNWMSVDKNRNRLMEVPSGSAIGVLGAPVEVSLWTSGIYAGLYEDKYKYSADFGDQRVWGWSSVGTGGYNIGLWNVSASIEYYPGGPTKRELMSHIGTTILNMTKGSHYGGGTDATWASGEVWTHAYGPYFIYCNNVTNSLTGTNQAAQALYSDALAQAAAEATAWPYSWCTNIPAYSPPAGRGTLAGQIVINDIYNSKASASNLWVGVLQQPLTSNGNYDFQKWMKPYEFWVKTDANGNFTIPNVIAGTNYTLYAFGPGEAGTFQSQAQTGGSPPNTVDIPASPFSVTMTAGTTNNLGTVTWTPTRVGPTVFEIGYPDRNSTEFRHGEDWWVGDIGPAPTNPLPVWSKFLEYPFDFPNGPGYVVGQSRWTTDWNYVQPAVVGSSGSASASTSTITFNLPSAPGATASMYVALSSDESGPLLIQANGTTVANYTPAYHTSTDESDSTTREGIHGMYTDNRATFSGSVFHQGQNTITVQMSQGGNQSNHAMYDYLRLELTGYVPPPPASVAVYPGNNCNLISWPVTPGATGYNILRSTTSGSGFASITNGLAGPVCGSGWNNATYLDTNVVNLTTYYYMVQSVNTVGSTNSPQSLAATPGTGFSTTAPAVATGLTIGSSGHHSVTVNWSASAGANFYTVYRSTLFNNGGGASNVLNTIVLANNVTGTTYTDNSPTDGSIYGYSVAATGAGGTSTNSNPAVAVPLPAPPAAAPGSLTANYSQTTNVVLNWSSVSGAVGYVVRRATSPGGPFTFLMSVTETTYNDVGVNVTQAYYYQVSAVNAAGVSPNATASIGVSPPSAPASLSAVPGNAQVTLSWPAVSSAAAYHLYSGISSGNETTLVAGNYAGTSYTNTGLANGTTYYFVVTATNSAGVSPRSPEASATPSTNIDNTPRNLIWKGDGSANLWNLSGTANWMSNGLATVFNNSDTVTFDDNGSNNVAVTLAGALQPSLVTYTASKNYTLGGAGSIAGVAEIVGAGSGTLTISTTNTYSGGTILSNGVIAPSGPVSGAVTENNYALGAGPVDFAGGTLQLYGYGLTDVKVGGLNLGYGSFTNNIEVDGGQSGTILGGPRYTFGSTVTGGGTLNLGVNYLRADITADWTGFTGALNVINLPGATASTTSDFRVVNANGFPNVHLALGTNLLMYSRATAGSTIPIGEFSATTNTTVSAGSGSGAGAQNAVTWRVGGLNTDCTNAAVFAGTTALIKEGAGTWTLTGASTHTGTTVVNNGTLLVNGSFSGSPVTVSGGSLGGIGTLSGAAVNVGSGGAFAPGNPSGILTVNNSLTLASGSTTFMQVQHSPLTNNAANISGTLTEGGVLNVTNIGAAALVAGDSFRLFNAANYLGSFAGYVLPPLGPDLIWNTTTLKTNGILSVVPWIPPVMAVHMAGGNLVLSGTGAPASWTYYVLSSTNISLPTTNWTRMTTNQTDGNGNFSATNGVDSNLPQTFLILQF
jgi:autotransporter-associated beta strand protein